MDIEVTMKSGAVVRAEADEVATEMDRIEGGLAKLFWRTPAGRTRGLQYIDISEIAAIVNVWPSPIPIVITEEMVERGAHALGGQAWADPSYLDLSRRVLKAALEVEA